MKRRELEKRLRHAGCYLKREGGAHSLWINPRTGVVEAIPRHSEIKESKKPNKAPEPRPQPSRRVLSHLFPK